MAKQTEEQKLIRTWWMRLLLALVFLGIAYGFISLAIDSGSLWQYVIGVGFLLWTIKYLARDVRLVFHR
ncbi:MAG TPA: hypothetical protein VLE51_03475 [Candidatus Saccharimonadales bacterium]|nr:hypothetical protein [Candidatus Saccharimonadales bacterium]